MAESTVDVSTLAAVRATYEAGTSCAEVVASVVARIEADADRNAWIAVADEAALMGRAAQLDGLAPAQRAELGLFGVPVAVKDNIDVGGLPTTAGCPAYAFTPDADATAVARLLAAGAIVVGKTNLDQFATGLVGTRSPFGLCRSVVDPALISGGSSSGSAVAVAAGHVPVALGTDTAGSGRVPAQANELVGLKPSRGLVPVRGVVPACWSIDCVSVFAHDVADAETVLAAIAGVDALDRFSRAVQPLDVPGAVPRPWRVGVVRHPGEPCDAEDAELTVAAAERLHRALARTDVGAAPLVDVDLSDFRAAGELLYGGSWLAERYAAVGEFIDANLDDVHPVVGELVGGARSLTGAGVFDDIHTLAELDRRTAPVWDALDLLVIPTAASLPTVDEVLAEPFTANARLGAFTNFVNLLDLSALAVPAGRRGDGRPAGVTLLAPAGGDARLAAAARLGGW